MYVPFYWSGTLKTTENNRSGKNNCILPAGGEQNQNQYAHLTRFVTTELTMEISCKIVFLSVIAR